MKVHGIIQARLGSTRLPGKVFLDLGGQILLQRVINRAKLAKKIDEIIIATTTNPKDSDIEQYCLDHNIKYFRGSEEDVLGRYVKTAENFGSDITVRITSDNPFGEPVLFDQLIEKHTAEKLDYTFSVGFPLGSSCEIFNTEALSRVSGLTRQPSYHEHLGTYFLDHQTDFKIGSVKAPKHLAYPMIRLTVDTPEDFETAQRLFKELPENFSLGDIISLWKFKEDIFVNRDIQQYYPSENIKKVFSGMDPK